jgi:hypothetical protein
MPATPRTSLCRDFYPAACFARLALCLLAFVLVAVTGTFARADDATHPVKVDDAQHGLVVLGLGNTVDIAWPLARAVYGDASLRPGTLDEAHARILVGEPADDASTAELRDLADLRAAIHGDDGASRRLLESIALSLHVNGVVVVEAGATADARPAARVYVTTSQAYDAVRYEPDPPTPVTWGGATALTWGSAVQALHRGFADAPLPAPAPPEAVSVPAVHAVPALPNGAHPDKGKEGKRAFYQSPWFWAAAGAALFAAGAVYLATRSDSTSDNIQLQVQVPK